MAYAAGRRICDADSHILETLDWVDAHADAEIKPRLRPLGLKSAGASAETAIMGGRVAAPVREAVAA